MRVCVFLYFSYLSCRLLCAVVLFFFRKTTRPFNRVAFSLALSIRFFPFCCSPRCFSSSGFLTLCSVPPSAVLCSHPVSSALPLLPPTPSSSFYSLGELYPVNRGTLLVTVCNLTEDQTKHDLAQPPPFCPPLLYILLFSYPRTTICVRGRRICGKAHRA